MFASSIGKWVDGRARRVKSNLHSRRENRSVENYLGHIWLMHNRIRLCIIPFLAVALTSCIHLSADGTPAVHRTAAPGKSISYLCESGYGVDAVYRSGTTAIVRYAGTVREMTIAISASGARYVGGGLEWWTKGVGPGSTGILFRHEDDATTGEIVERCTEQ